jgi:hypothetical protein
MTPAAPAARAVRQATRAPFERPHWISGSMTPRAVSRRSAPTSSVQAASCFAADPGARAPLTR